MSKYSNVLEVLKRINKVNGFSLGLHTTSGFSAERIVGNGLEERAGRTMEGTVKIFGDVKNDVELGDLDWFFPYTDATVMVAIPSMFKVERGLDADGGNLHTSDFSLFVTLAKDGLMGDSAKEIFGKNGRLKIPTELIIGYYDKSGQIHLNEKCAMLYENPEFLKVVEEIFNNQRNKSFLEFYKMMNKDSLNYGDNSRNKPKSNE